MRTHLDRIEAVNHLVNAVTLVLEEDALRMAREADRKVAAGQPIGPLHGVPITLKENMDLVGSATTHGVAKLRDSMPRFGHSSSAQSSPKLVTRRFPR